MTVAALHRLPLVRSRDPMEPIWRELEVLRNRLAKLEAEAATRRVRRALPEAELQEVTMADRIRMRDIAQAVAQENEITLADILGQSRQRASAWPRQTVMLLASEAGFSNPQIGRFLARDHTTVLSGIRAARARRDAMGGSNGN